jgi:hypothetical protein
MKSRDDIATLRFVVKLHHSRASQGYQDLASKCGICDDFATWYSFRL